MIIVGIVYYWEENACYVKKDFPLVSQGHSTLKVLMQFSVCTEPTNAKGNGSPQMGYITIKVLNSISECYGIDAQEVLL